MNLSDYPRVRKALYALQWVAGLVMGILGIILTAQFGIEHLPDWYTITGLVLTFVWTYTGTVAQTNTPTPYQE